MEKINFAIIGCGRIAQRHAEHINNNGRLVAVCDIDLEKRNNWQKNMMRLSIC
jgi:predicted dehydrogenase